MDRERIDGWCERAIIALVLGILTFGPLATGAVRPVEFLVLQGLTVAALCLWGIRLWLKPRPQLLIPPLAWAVAAFTTYAVVRYSLADIEYIARLELIRVLVYASLFFIILNNLHRQETVNLVGYWIVFLAMGIAFYAGYQFFTHDSRVWHFSNEAYKGRGTGTFINANHLAGFLEMILPLGLAYTIVGRMKPLLRVLLGYASIVIAAGIGFSLSRGGWLATGLALMVFFVILLFRRGSRIPAALALLIMLLGVGYYASQSSLVQKRAESVLKDTTQREYSRYQLWLPAVDLWRENIWLGIGPAHFDYRFRSVRPQDIQLRPDRVHNDFLNTLVDWGIAGLALVLTAMALVWLGVARSWRHVGAVAADIGSRRSNRFAFVLGGSIGLLALFFHSITDFNMHIPGNAILAVALMALLASHLRFATERWWFSLQLPAAALVTLGLVAGAGTLAWTGIRRAAEHTQLVQAGNAPNYSTTQATILQRAFDVEPKNFETAAGIGECYRVQSWEGGENYAELAETAIRWFARASKLNPYDSFSILRQGMCLDWLGRTEEATPCFSKAEELDPNGYFTVAHVGWHYVQTGDYAAARPWFERSLRLQRESNPIAQNYLDLCNQRLLEAATNTAPGRLSLPAQ
jgi:O-antigen ligase